MDVQGGATALTAFDVILILLGAAAFLLWRRYGSDHQKRPQRLPPGPRNWPLIGAMPAMKPSMQAAFLGFAETYGPVTYFRLGVQNVVLVSTAETAEEVLRHKDASFANRSCTMNRSMGKYAGFDCAAFPFADYDAELKLLRKTCITEFFTTAKLKSYEKIRSREMAVMVDNIFGAITSHDNSNCSSSESAVTVGIRGLIVSLVRNIIFVMCFGKRFDDLPPKDMLRRFPQVLEDRMRIFMRFNLTNYLPWLEVLDPQKCMKEYKQIYQMLKDYYGEILEKHRKLMQLNQDENEDVFEGKPTNFVDVLLRIQQEDGNLSDDGILGTVLSMMTAGVDTTSSESEWVILQLARLPEFMKRLQDEVDAVVGRERPVEEADIRNMPFLNAFVMECFRLLPAVPFTFPHVSMDSSTLGGFHVPAKAAVIVNLQSIGRDPKFWNNPQHFNPDRFIDGGEKPCPLLASECIGPNGSDFKVLPFGRGRRSCPGYNLALPVVMRIAATLVHAFDWAAPLGQTIDDLSTEAKGSFIRHPKSAVVLRPTPRLPRHVYKQRSTGPV